MITKMYCVHDTAVKAFTAPHFARTHGEAERNFKHAVNDSKSGHLSANPEQFTLFYLGDYDDETGIVSPLAAPQAVVTGAQCKDPTGLRAVNE